MVVPRSCLSILLFALASLEPAITYHTAEKRYPEVILGPGLPTLAELGLTSADLYTMKINLTAASLAQKDSSSGCGPNDSSYTDVNDIIACFHFLNNLGQTPCILAESQSDVQFCISGQGQVLGQTGSSGIQSSFRSDVASVVLFTINSCTRPDQSVAGFQAANGDGNLVVLSGNPISEELNLQ